MNGDWKHIKDQVINTPYKGDIHNDCPNGCKAPQNLGSTMTTLVGYTDGVDRNHRWTDVECSKCHMHYTLESKAESKDLEHRWLTKDGKILFGIPACFESYIYTCKCGGDITKEGSISTSKMVDGKWTTYYPRTFSCNKCDWKLSVTD